MRIGFTVGVWDLFHHGHSVFLKRAKNYCDYLIVGIMNDYWVKVQKGEERPIDTFYERLNNLRYSNLADKIVILDTLDMSPYLQIADIWIKGELQKNMRPVDYKNVVLIERTPIISTTYIINKLRS
jgi:D-beta-D-heptose 7-phosphate kinase/D-beta-D-heptose 1-phosphate adenosyltransferase